MEDKQKNNNFSNTGCFIAIVLLVITLFIILKIFTGWWDSLGDNTTDKNKKPDDVELMSYAQTILKDNLNNPKYSSYKGDYNFIQTGSRYKIEGNVTVNGIQEKFYMIINFTDDTYKEYDLILLQVGDKKIH